MRDPGLPFPQGPLSVPSGRATPAEVAEQASLCLNDPLLHAVLEAVDSYAVVLNAQRQILAANPVFLQALAAEDPAVSRGLRLGESLACVHAAEGADGCGSSRACRRCGALLSVLAHQESGQPTSGECLLSLQKEGRWEAREFAVRSQSLAVAGHPLTLLTLQDISAQKRRDSLERIFIHDLLNSLQGLRGWTELLQSTRADPRAVAERILDLAGHLTAEVESQRRLLQAECGELVPEFRTVDPGFILEALGGSLEAALAARLDLLPLPTGSRPISTDPAILGRILGNMVLNAIEAMPAGGQVRVWFELRSGHPAFVVENPGCMAPEVADRIFQRSFSTKADRGRGLGTYGMKVLGESVLGGQVSFTTHPREGTRFCIELPAATPD